MRDYLVLAILLGSIPLCVFRPFFGILMWCWISYLNPHRFAWGIAYNFPAAMVVGAATLTGLAATRERQAPPRTVETVLLLALWALFTVTTYAAIHPDEAWNTWWITTKILVMTFATMMLVRTQSQLRIFLLVIALSVGFLGIKGGIFSILSGGQHRVYGPEESFLGDNNDLALALNMTLPLLYYQARMVSSRPFKLFLVATFILCIVATIFTYSRGGFLGLCIVLLMLLLKSRRKLLGLLLLAATVGIALSTLPVQYLERIQTVRTYEQDTSALGRLEAWAFSWNVALDRPLTGGGFKVASPETYARYRPQAERSVDAHSIYFEILGEHGFLALGLFLWLLLAVLGSCRRLVRTSRRDPSLHWIADTAQMLHTSLAAYMVSGLFLSRAYFDLAYHVIAAVVILKGIAQREVRALALAAAPPAEDAAVATSSRWASPGRRLNPAAARRPGIAR